jgi:hypothetical protein
VPADANIKATIVGVVEALYASDSTTYAPLRVALGDPGASAPYDTVTISGLELLVGSAWHGGAADPEDQEAGCDPDLYDNTPFSIMTYVVGQQGGGAVVDTVDPTANDDAGDETAGTYGERIANIAADAAQAVTDIGGVDTDIAAIQATADSIKNDTALVPGLV